MVDIISLGVSTLALLVAIASFLYTFLCNIYEVKIKIFSVNKHKDKNENTFYEVTVDLNNLSNNALEIEDIHYYSKGNELKFGLPDTAHRWPLEKGATIPGQNQTARSNNVYSEEQPDSISITFNHLVNGLSKTVKIPIEKKAIDLS